MKSDDYIAPPTIADLKSQRVTGARVRCPKCNHYAAVPFEKMGRPETTPFPDLKFKCEGCGARAQRSARLAAPARAV